MKAETERAIRMIALRQGVRERREVRKFLADRENPWCPHVLTDADVDLGAALQRLADLGLTEDQMKEWVSGHLFEIDYPAETVRRMERAEEAAS
jgi:hypothetical protein